MPHNLKTPTGAPGHGDLKNNKLKIPHFVILFSEVCLPSAVVALAASPVPPLCYFFSPFGALNLRSLPLYFAFLSSRNWIWNGDVYLECALASGWLLGCPDLNIPTFPMMIGPHFRFWALYFPNCTWNYWFYSWLFILEK